MQKAFFMICLAMLGMVGYSSAQDTHQLSSHILDVAAGQPAANVRITLSKLDKQGQWVKVDDKVTDTNGRVKDFLPISKQPHTGVYKLTFHTKPYFEKQGKQSFYPFIDVVFELADNAHYHVPITLSAFGYSTYRGN